MKFDPSAYAVGDIVKVTETFVVESAGNRSIWLVDVKDAAHRFTLWPSEHGSGRIEMVKKAARPTPKAGEILTGKEVGKAQWKRGSMIRCTRTPRLAPLVLFADGKWHDVEGVSAYEFDDLAPEAPFEVLLVA